jgi:hypothetical protein
MSKTTFRYFVESTRGARGEYVNDDVERYMVAVIINRIHGGLKDDKNYNNVYSFIESDTFEPFYDEYYDAHKEMLERLLYIKKNKGMPRPPVSSQTSKTINSFRENVHKLYSQWKDSIK